MPDDDADPVLRQMREQVRAGGSGRSKLSAWMAEREDAIATIIRTYGAAWDDWAASFIAAGLMPTPEGWGAEGPAGARARRRAAGAARMTWQRLRQRTAAAGHAPARQGNPPASVARTKTSSGSSDDMPRLLSRDAEAARRRLAALDREMRERSR